MTMTTENDTLNRERVLAIDMAAQIDDILAMPDHITDALWRAESAMMAPAEASSLVVCGIGGSAIGADLAVALCGDELARPISVLRGYDLPAWVGSETAVLCCSYSGNTEETLSAYNQAVERGSRVFVASSGGLLSELAHDAGQPVIGLPGILQPRASIAYGVTSAIEIGIVTGIVDSALRGQLAAAAGALRDLTARWSPDAAEDALPKRLAREARGRLTVTYGARLTAPVAYRWKCQINENAKLPAWSATLPESNHNEINSWQGAGETGQQLAWFLRDAGQHERVRRRIELNAEIVTAAGAAAEIIDSVGETPAERLFSSVLLGDLTSLYLAVLRGVDPSPVPVIEGLKDRLGRPAR